MEQRPVAKSIERALIVGLILTGWAFIIVFRLLELQVFAHDEYVKRAKRQQERLEPVTAMRGSIFDRNGNPLAISSPSQLAVVNPRRIPKKEIAAALLGRILGLDAKQLEKDLEAAGESKRHNGYLIVAEHVSEAQASTLRAMNLDWLEIREGSIRSYPNGDVAAHVIGNVDGEGNGVAGIELKLNKELAGTPGWVRTERDGREDSYSSEIIKMPAVGKDVGLTIDRELQAVARNALKAAVIENHADHGSLVAMDPLSGEVLALENYPTYDPNQRLHTGEAPAGREDLAVVAPFEPGSVFKVITLAAALETTDLRPESLINCGNGTIKIFGRVVHESHRPFSVLPMTDVLAFSSNIGAIRIGMQVGNKNLYEYIRRFGFGSRTGIELPAEAPGLLRPLKRWEPTSIGSVPMGHEVGVTSVQLAQAGSVIANGGFLVHPHLVAWEQESGGERVVKKYPGPVRILEPETVMDMRRMMRRVITEPHGTGHKLHVTGYTIAGKTGTAQIYDFAHHVYTHRYNASFMGFAPAQNPAITVVVTITGTTGEAGFGGTAAGPVFTRVISTALRRMGVVRDVPEDIEQIELAEKKNERVGGKSKDADDVTLAALNPPTEEEMKEASGGDANSSVIAIGANVPRVPDFVGKTVKDVMQEAAENGIEVELSGEGLARTQTPAAGVMLVAGEHVQVRFAR